MSKPSEKSARDFFPSKLDYDSVKLSARGCRGCDIYLNATQTVFGEGDLQPQLMFVGEQPGDREDIEGHPFVGPAGQLFDRALAEVGIDRSQTYVTNAVKHFKWKPQGKRRLHERPKASEVNACRPWLEVELEIVKPKILVFLGATAAQSMLGRNFRVTKMRGIWVDSEFAPRVMATIHPSAILRSRDANAREAQYRGFLADLELIAAEIRKYPLV